MSPERSTLEIALQKAKELNNLRENGQRKQPLTTEEIIGEQPPINFVAVPTVSSQIDHKSIYDPGNVLKEIKEDPQPGELTEIKVHSLRNLAAGRQIIVTRVKEGIKKAAPVVAEVMVGTALGVAAYIVVDGVAKRRRRRQKIDHPATKKP